MRDLSSYWRICLNCGGRSGIFLFGLCIAFTLRADTISIALSGDSLLVGSAERLVEINSCSGKVREICPNAGSTSSSAVIVPSWSQVVSVGGRIVQFWDLRTGRLNYVLRLKSVGNCICLAASKRVAIGCDDGAIYVVDVPTRRIVRILKGHSDSITAIAADITCSFLVSGSYDGTAVVWDKAQSVIAKREFAQEPLIAVDCNWAKGLVAICTDSGKAIVWDVIHSREKEIQPDMHEKFRAVKISPLHRSLIVGSTTRVAAFDIQNVALTGEFFDVEDEVVCLDIETSGRLVVGCFDGSVYFATQFRSGMCSTNVLRTHCHVGPVNSLDSCGGRLVSTGWDRSITCYSAHRCARHWRNHGTSEPRLLHAEDAVALFADGIDFRAIDRKRAGEYQFWSYHRTEISAVDFSDNNALIVSGDRLGQVAVWESSSKHPTSTFSVDGGAVTSLALSQDGTLVAAGTASGGVALFDLVTKAVLWSSQSHADEIIGIDVNKGSVTSLSKSGEIQRTQQGKSSLVQHLGVNAVVWSAVNRGHLVAVAISDQRVVVVDLQNAALVPFHLKLKSTVKALALDESRNSVAVICGEGAICIANYMSMAVRVVDATRPQLR